MKDKAIAIGSKDKRHFQQSGVIQSLLHAFANVMFVGFGFHHRQRHAGLVVQHDIGRFHFLAGSRLTTHHYLAITQFYFLTDLSHVVPACGFYGREDELGDDVGFGEFRLVDASGHGAGPCFENRLV